MRAEAGDGEAARHGSRQRGQSWSIDAGPLEGDQRLDLDADGLRLEFSVAAGIN